MAKKIKHSFKCPPGTFCIEKFTMIFIFLLVCIIFYLIYDNYRQKMVTKKTIDTEDNLYSHFHNNLLPHTHLVNSLPESGYDMLRPIMKPGISYNDNPKDTLMNPYSPPLQYNQPHTYRQVGYLKNNNYGNKMLPIFAKPIHTRRDKWYYYTIYDNIKLPIYSNGRKCSSEHGCDSLMNGETIYLENMSEPFTVYMYDNHTLTYEPVI
tara:strand:+ start:165 stop:788 length:624 start_codon:yes stop_codon:yes gene_type:complete